MTGYPTLPRLCPRWPGEHCAHGCTGRCALEPIRAPFRALVEITPGLYVSDNVNVQQLADITRALGAAS